MRRLIENNPSFSILAGGLIAMVFPYGEFLPGEAILLFLAGLIYIACFKIAAPIAGVLTLRNLIFCAARFLVFPILLWAVATRLFPDYATGLLLLALCPVAAASPALTGLYGGNVTLAFALTIFSSLTCVGIIPAVMALAGHAEVQIPALSMLKTLSLCILAPCLLFAASARVPQMRTLADKSGKLISVVLIALLIFTVIAKKRDYFLDHPEGSLLPLALTAAFYLLCYFMPMGFGKSRADRIGYMTCSGFNNVALSAGLAFLYFDERTIVFCVVAEFVWSLLPFVASRAPARFVRD
jgi:predicted Na+-dependent transporter